MNEEAERHIFFVRGRLGALTGQVGCVIRQHISKWRSHVTANWSIHSWRFQVSQLDMKQFFCM